jgi:hypothetical protein
MVMAITSRYSASLRGRFIEVLVEYGPVQQSRLLLRRSPSGDNQMVQYRRKADPARQEHLFAARVFNRRAANFSDCVSDVTSLVITLANVIAVNQIAKVLVHNSAWHANRTAQLNQAAQETMLPLINRHQSDPFSFYSKTSIPALSHSNLAAHPHQ